MASLESSSGLVEYHAGSSPGKEEECKSASELRSA
jgi:hypothetical protein